MLTKDSPQSRALFRLLIGAAENAKASKRNSPIHYRDVARAVALQLGLPVRAVQKLAKLARRGISVWAKSVTAITDCALNTLLHNRATHGRIFRKERPWFWRLDLRSASTMHGHEPDREAAMCALPRKTGPDGSL